MIRSTPTGRSSTSGPSVRWPNGASDAETTKGRSAQREPLPGGYRDIGKGCRSCQAPWPSRASQKIQRHCYRSFPWRPLVRLSAKGAEPRSSRGTLRDHGSVQREDDAIQSRSENSISPVRIGEKVLVSWLIWPITRRIGLLNEAPSLRLDPRNTLNAVEVSVVRVDCGRLRCQELRSHEGICPVDVVVDVHAKSVKNGFLV